MKKSFKKLVSLLLAMALLVPMLSVSVTAEPESQAFTYVKGGNDVSESYKNSKFYDYLSRVKITGDGRTDVIAVALTQSGYMESDIPGDFAGTYVGGWKDFTEYNYNMGDWGAGYGYDESIGAALHWCASFVSWAILQSRVYTLQKGSISDWCRKHNGLNGNTYDESYIWREVGVGHWADQVKRAGYFKDPGVKGGTYKPLTGDIIYFTWDGTTRDHIGLVVYSDENYVYTVEGNTDDSEFADNSACCAVKSYPLDSKYIYGYGAMPYESVPSAAIDFSGKNRTTGYYMNTNGAQTVYADKDCQGTIIGKIVRNTMFGVVEVCDNGMLKVVSEVYGGSVVMGYINPNTTRTLQITNEPITTKSKLQMLTDSVMGVYYKEYTEETLAKIRSAYIEAKAVLANTASTDADYNAMYEKLNTLLATKGTNAATAGARVNFFDQRISSGICTILTPDFNNGVVTSSGANLTYASALKAKWDSTENAYKVVGVIATGNGVPIETTIASDEIVIAAHDWETGVTEDPVLGSATNFKTIKNAKSGQFIRMYGIDMENKTFAPGAYISIEGEGDGLPVAPDLKNLVLGKDGGVKGYGSYTANLTDGVAAGELTYDDSWFAFYYRTGGNTSNGVGTLVYDLGAVKGVHSLMVNAFVGNDSGIVAPTRITAYIGQSADGPFTKMGDFTFGTAYNNVAWASLEKTANGRYVKIEVQGSDTDPFVFINEVMVLGNDDKVENPDIPDPDDVMKGDINGNGTLDVMDCSLLKRAYFGIYALDNAEVGDISGNGSIDTMDYPLLKRAYFGAYTIS
ncbi:MAG: hypothetical protein E7586_01290 [Ruminococcaceae bacterium]|nr:hypothetical protein [Oscillospiraceae bacterium]